MRGSKNDFFFANVDCIDTLNVIFEDEQKIEWGKNAEKEQNQKKKEEVYKRVKNKKFLSSCKKKRR